MADSIRLKLLFVNPPPACPQFVWFLMNLTSCSIIADLCGAIKKRFFEDLRGVKLDLTMDDCALLPQEDIHLLKDNDTIRVKCTVVQCDQSKGKKRKHTTEVEVTSKPKKSKHMSTETSTTKSQKTLQSSPHKVKLSNKKGNASKRHSQLSSSSSCEDSAVSKEPTNVSTAKLTPSTQTTAKVTPSTQTTAKVTPSTQTTAKVTLSTLTTAKVTNTKNPTTAKNQPLHAKSAKSKTGGVHTKFHSSTSSSSSSSDSEEMDIGKKGKKQSCTPSPKSTSSATGNGPVSSEMPSQAPNMGPPSVASSLKNNIGNLKQAVLGRGRGQPSNLSRTKGKGRGNGSKQSTAPPIVGGVSDTLRTTSVVYTNNKPGNLATTSVGSSIVAEIVQERDYSSLKKISGPPREGDHIAFQVLEMTSDYTPTLSDYKEAVVLSVSEETKTVKISYTEATLQREKEKESKMQQGKFALAQEGEGEGEIEPAELQKEVEMSLDRFENVRLVQS